jgi:hypothetical protein
MMKIIFERSGGFMGRNVKLELDLADLPPDQAEILKRLVEESDFFSLTESLPKAPAPDGFTYTITVITTKIRHTVNTADTSAPEVLRPLLDELSTRARAR